MTESTTYAMWIQEKQFMLVSVCEYVAKAVASFKEFRLVDFRRTTRSLRR